MSDIVSMPPASVVNLGSLDFPTGVMLPYAGSLASVPQGFLACDGSAVSRGDYSRLFGVIGTLYGPGDGATTFNLPPADGRALYGAGGKLAIGANDGRPAALRSPSHHHDYFEANVNYGGTDRSGFNGGGLVATSGDADNLDSPAHLVIGGHIIKT